MMRGGDGKRGGGKKRMNTPGTQSRGMAPSGQAASSSSSEALSAALGSSEAAEAGLMEVRTKESATMFICGRGVSGTTLRLRRT